MTRPLRLLCVLAHPDDESLGLGGTLAKYAAQGVETYLLCATRGERGWRGPKEEHPDHVAICQFTLAALVCAADARYPPGLEPHRVAKFYYVVDSKPLMELFTQIMGGPGISVDGTRREFAGWDEWAITTRIEASDYWQTAWQAILCHQSQSHTLEVLRKLPEETHRQVWGQGSFYRVYSLVNGGRQPEQDLFEGLEEITV